MGDTMPLASSARALLVTKDGGIAARLAPHQSPGWAAPLVVQHLGFSGSCSWEDISLKAADFPLAFSLQSGHFKFLNCGVWVGQTQDRGEIRECSSEYHRGKAFSSQLHSQAVLEPRLQGYLCMGPL